MPSPADLGNMMDSFGMKVAGAGAAKYVTIAGWFFWAIIIVGILYAVYLFFSFRYKLTIFEGSVEKDEKTGKYIARVLRTFTDRARPIKDKGVAKWKLLLTWGKKIEPIDNKYIMPGKRVFLFKTGQDTYNPMPIHGGNPSACFKMDPFDASFYYLGVQQDARDYAKDDAAKKAMIFHMAVIIFNLILTGLVCWFILKATSTSTEHLNGIKTAFENIQGMAPK